MSTARNYRPHYTVDDYAQWQGDWELWQGIAVAMTPSPFGRRQYVVANIVASLHRQLRAVNSDCRVLHEIDWHIADDFVVRPDVVIVCDGVPEQFLESPPALIVEVLSPSTEGKDRSAKFGLYEAQQVSYYVMADPSQQKLEAFHLRDRSYVPLSEITFNLPGGCRASLEPSVFE